MNSDEVFNTANTVCFAKTGKHLNTTQRAIILGSVEQLTYDEIGQRYGYSGKYLRQDAGPELWNLLSQALGEEVGKKSFLLALERWRSHRSIPAYDVAEIFSSEAAEPELFPLSLNPQADWGGVPDISPFYGRTSELDQLKQKIWIDGCRLVTLFGMAGMGKTALSIKLAESVRDQFDQLIWRSLHPAPPLPKLLADLLQGLSRTGEDGATLSTFIDYMRNHRCLIILDGLESVLKMGVHDGSYWEGYEAYSDFLQRVGNTVHQSCLLLTSREKPKEVAMMEGETHPSYSLEVDGLDESVGKQIFEGKGCFLGSASDWRALIRRYQGNPFALHYVATTVQDLFSGDIANFLSEFDHDSVIFGEVRDLLDQQFARLSDLEKTILCWLHQNNEPIQFREILSGMGSPISREQLQEVLQSLRRRSLIDVKSARYSLPTLIIAYVTHCLQQ